MRTTGVSETEPFHTHVYVDGDPSSTTTISDGPEGIHRHQVKEDEEFTTEDSGHKHRVLP